MCIAHTHTHTRKTPYTGQLPSIYSVYYTRLFQHTIHAHEPVSIDRDNPLHIIST